VTIISLGSDHAGYLLKEYIKTFLEKNGYGILDFGTYSIEPVDYPDFIIPAAEAIINEKAKIGIVFGGSGNGEAITANKIKGIRCAVCWNIESARLAKEHNNANMISLGERMIQKDDAMDIVEIWLKSKFEEGRHEARINKISIYEDKNGK
jgi:ribose 5-phosphate isomerase B